jgi:hypothetical protein
MLERSDALENSLVFVQRLHLLFELGVLEAVGGVERKEALLFTQLRQAWQCLRCKQLGRRSARDASAERTLCL